MRIGCARTPSLISVLDPGWLRVGRGATLLKGPPNKGAPMADLPASYVEAHRFDGAVIQRGHHDKVVPCVVQPRDLAIVRGVWRYKLMTAPQIRELAPCPRSGSSTGRPGGEAACIPTVSSRARTPRERRIQRQRHPDRRRIRPLRSRGRHCACRCADARRQRSHRADSSPRTGPYGNRAAPDRLGAQIPVQA